MIGASARGRQEAEIFVFYWRTRGPDPRGAYTASTWLSPVSLKKADPPARSAGHNTLTGHYGLTREVTRISRVMTRPDPRDFETPLTRPAGRVMTREKP